MQTKLVNMVQISTTITAAINNSIEPSSSIDPSLPPLSSPRTNPFRPSIAIVIGVLFTIFSLTFLLLLYIKHCRRGEMVFVNNTHRRPGTAYPTAINRKNSGIDPTVIDSLPMFRFASLRGQKDGLECAVCLNRFEPTELLRLLPKCKHAFHVECVDTWLDAHSTCPLCRYRVDPEDILLVDDRSSSRSSSRSFRPHNENSSNDVATTSLSSSVPCSPRKQQSGIRTLGRHSSAGESRRNSSVLEVIVEKPSQNLDQTTKKSLDSWNSFNKKGSNNSISGSSNGRIRKDGLLLEKTNSGGGGGDGGVSEHRLEHRIILSGMEIGGPQQRWSDVEPSSDLLYLQTEMILDDSRRLGGSRGLRPCISRQGSHSINNNSRRGVSFCNNVNCSGRNIINERSVSEISGLNRFRGNEGQHRRQRHEVGGAVTRWMAWVSQNRSQPSSQSQPGGAAGGGTPAPATVPIPAGVSRSSSSTS